MPVLRSLAASLAILLTAAGAAMAQFPPDMAWRYSQFTDEGNKGRMTSMAVLGVPETDYILGHARCFAGSTAGLPMLEIAADTGGAAEGAPLGIEFQADAGPMFYQGTAKAAQSEEDYTGVRVELDMNDPLWQVLMRMNRITYRVNGNAVEIPLRGSSQAISSLLADCRVYHGNFNPNGGGQTVQPAQPAPAQPANQAFDPRWATCDQLGGQVSQNSDVPVNMTFVNQSDGFRAIYWIGFDGQPKQYATLNPGEEFAISTFMTHPWMFTDGPGNCIEMFMPQPGISVFNITAPGRDFGPE